MVKKIIVVEIFNSGRDRKICYFRIILKFFRNDEIDVNDCKELLWFVFLLVVRLNVKFGGGFKKVSVLKIWIVENGFLIVIYVVFINKVMKK